ncbi:MAG: GNAT family N-acetyltransferase [Edaphobacter sp.]
MQRNDVPSAMELSIAANWNQTPEDWHCVLQLFEGGCRCIEDAGKIVATAALLPYDTTLGWIGMVLTRPEYRRQGLAKRLMEDAIANADRSHIRTLKLDATDAGRPLYESLGFVVEDTVERWGRDGGEWIAAKQEGTASKAPSYSTQIDSDFLSRDVEAFGADRKKLLESLSASGRCHATANGYVLSRPGRTSQYLGPCVAGSAADARQLIASHLEVEDHLGSDSRSWYWDLLSANPEAIRYAEQSGFTRRRTLWRMRRGEALQNNDAMVYAIAGFELG